MKTKYTIKQCIDPMTFQPRIGISFDERLFMFINLEMSAEESNDDHHPFSKKENFENDWKEIGEAIKEYFGIL